MSPYELRRPSSNGTPMKMLIAHEMSKAPESKQRPANLVARLMGLDALPEQQPNPLPQRSQIRQHLQNPSSQPESPLCYRKNKGDILYEQMQYGIHAFKDRQEYKDVYEVWQQFPNMSFVEHKSPEKARYREKLNESRMDLVRQKFSEAKRLATDENLRHSKEFKEAIEVLSSNKELFLKFLQEPNSLFSQHLSEVQSSPSHPLITVLRPSKSLANNKVVGCEEMSQKLIQKQNQEVEADLWEENKARCYSTHPRNNTCTHPRNNTCTPPTRIVLLKPSPRTIHDTKTMASFPAFSSKQLQNNDCFTESENDESQCSREYAKEITRQLRRTLSSCSREDTLLSSVCSNGYVGDGSSFNRSDNEYVGEGNFSDSEIMTPTSRVSWDFVNKFESPHSSSFSQASYSPDTSVCREAKKRLSERWTMMSSTANGKEHRQVRRSSSTLGEMLALSGTKNLGVLDVEGVEEVSVSTGRSFGAEQELKSSTSFLSSNEKKGESEHDSPKNMLRSRSVPVSSTAYGSRLNVEVPGSEIIKSDVSSGVKSKSVKSSFRGKVSSLFFLKNKKENKNKSVEFPLDSAHKTQPAFAKAQGEMQQSAPVKDSNDIRCITKCGVNEGCFPRRIVNCGLEEGCLPIPRVPLHSRTASPSTYMEQKQAEISHEVALSIANPGNACSSGENLDQPSPVSVLEAPFKDEDTTPQLSASLKTELHGSLVNHHSLKPNLIAKSPPIESLARSLASSGDASDLATTPAHSDYSAMPTGTVEEQEWLLFIEKLLSLAGMNNEEFSGATSAKWHSPQCPLDPKLLEKFINLKDRFHWHEAKPRQWRSKQKLILDSTNEALVDIRKYGSNARLWRRSLGATHNVVNNSGRAVTAKDIWNQVKEWFSGDTQCFFGESEDSNSLVVERAVKKEVMEGSWIENMKLEVGGLEREIVKKVLDELVEDMLFELTECVF